jgi:aminoglycoside phosphotransferase (APT) family kinase protein
MIETEQEILDEYGPEILKLCERAAKKREWRIALAKRKDLLGRLLNWIEERKIARAGRNFIMHGPGGD